jgi:hypothetical protein
MVFDPRIRFPLFFFVASFISTSFTGQSWTSIGLMVVALTWAGLAFGKPLLRRLEYQLIVVGVGCLALLKSENIGPVASRVVNMVVALVLVVLLAKIVWMMTRTLLSAYKEVEAVRRRMHSHRH